jgi:hypothetical protein
MIRLAALCAAATLAAGCATPLVDFARPLEVRRFDPAECRRGRHAHDPAYDAARARWGRTAWVVHDYDTALEAHVMLFSDDFLGAWLHKVARMRCLAPEDYRELVDTQIADTSRYVVAMVVMTTSRWDWNDLGSAHSVWTLSFLDESERSVEAVGRQASPDKLDTLEELYPGVTPFTRAWLVRFPRTFADGTPLIRPDARWVTIRFAGPLGKADVRWQSRR